jgi:hypothetical protein
MALLPGQTQSTFVLMTSSTATTSIPTVTSRVTAVATVSAAVSSATATVDAGLPIGLVGAITTGSTFGAMLLVGIIAVLVMRYKKKARMIQPDQQDGPDGSRPSANARSLPTTESNRLRGSRGSRGSPLANTADAVNPEERPSPMVRERLPRPAEARDALWIYELNGSNPLPSELCSNPGTKPIFRLSANNSLNGTMANQHPPNHANRTSAISSIRRVRPSSTHELSCAESNPSDSPEPLRSESVVSPNSSIYAPTPLVGGVSPLLNKWQAGDRASVGETSATVDGPINWFSPVHIKSRDSSQSRDVARSSVVTSATGGDAKYVTPESAMENGYTAESVESLAEK